MRRDGASELILLWRSVRPYVWIIPLLTVALTATAYVYTARLPRVYQATCTVEYDPSPPRPLGSEVEDVAEPTNSYWASHEFYDTQNLIIQSRVVAERVVRQLGLNEDPSFPSLAADMPATWHGITVEEAATILQGRITVEPVEGTRVVEVAVRDRSPERAAVIANAVVDSYIEKTIEDRLSSTVTALDWLHTQLDDLRGQLTDSELALHNFWEENDILSVSMEDRQNLVASQLEEFSTALTAARTRRIELRARLTRLQALANVDEQDDVGAAFEDYPTIQSLEESLRTHLAERESLTTRYGPAHPRIQELDHEIAGTRTAIHAEVQAVIRAVESELREAGDIESGLSRAVNEANQAGLQLNLLSIEYASLDRARESQAHLYDIVLERTTETDLTRMLRTSHVRVVDRALAPQGAVSPRLPVNLAAGALLGLLLGVGLAFLLARLDRRIKSMQQVEDLGLAVIGVVPIVADSTPETAPAQRGRRRRKGGDKGGVEEPKIASRDLLAHTQPMSSAAESLRTLRTNLMFMAADTQMRSLVVTSGSPREGKTTIAANLAISIAQSGKRVLLVDTDMRRPRLHQALGVPAKPGITNVLVGDAKLVDVVRPTVVPGLTLLPCGPVPPNPSELLHREKFQQLAREAEQLYDFIIYDSPPLGPVTDAAILASLLDGVLFVVKGQVTTIDSVRSVIRQLGDVQANLVGVVINAFDPRHSRYDSGGGYYYYRREGYYGSHDDDDEPPRPSSAPEEPRPPSVN